MIRGAARRTVRRSEAKGIMMRRTATAAVAMLAASLAATGALPAVARATAAPGIRETVIWSGLNTPRHLVLTEAGLVVTEPFRR